MPITRREFLVRAAHASGASFATMQSLRAETPELWKLGIVEASALIRRKAVSPVELTQACLARIEKLNPLVNAFITVTAEQALQQARDAEKEIQRGQWRGPLHGIPIALKDLIDTQGIRTTAASAVFKDRVPTEDAEVVQKLKSAGAVMLEAIAGYDALEPTSVDWPVERYSNGMRMKTRSLRLGVVRRPYFEQLDPDIEARVKEAIQALEGIASKVREVELAYSNLLMTVASAEAYSFHAPYFTKNPELYQPMTRRRLEQAATISASAYIAARREMDQLRRQAGSAFSTVDLLISPTTVISPISIEAGTADPPLPPDGTPVEFRNTHMFDVLGLPAISIPCGFTRDGMPVGLQIAGPRFAESRVLALAHAYQQVTDWHTRRPPS